MNETLQENIDYLRSVMFDIHDPEHQDFVALQKLLDVWWRYQQEQDQVKQFKARQTELKDKLKNIKTRFTKLNLEFAQFTKQFIAQNSDSLDAGSLQRKQLQRLQSIDEQFGGEASRKLLPIYKV